ncbi:hypothetical protein FPY71_07815 [Aureimonas fodinaquatilis]|uniref:Uncharacterized protein n=1 Tax=Aureimonas fodinaquatilis TaxID=2565783 RepID=A0A5B0DUG5_9HYPH|nr:hypothetical protein [Aureimonas fodinaquatilis]KAA0970414.1 hypothetical protein FPY71_07815 [Aureimonas fodinaquatilis]
MTGMLSAHTAFIKAKSRRTRSMTRLIIGKNTDSHDAVRHLKLILALTDEKWTAKSTVCGHRFSGKILDRATVPFSRWHRKISQPPIWHIVMLREILPIKSTNRLCLSGPPFVMLRPEGRLQFMVFAETVSL